MRVRVRECVQTLKYPHNNSVPADELDDEDDGII